MSALGELFTAIESARQTALEKNGKPWPRTQPTASDLSPCAREMALGVLHWAERPGFDTKLLARFEAGSDKEPSVYRRLLEYGFTVVEAQRTFELKGKNGGIVLRGRIDGQLEWQGRRYPFDIKTVDPLLFPKLQTLEAIRQHPFFSKWVRQIMAYCYMADVDTGFLLMENLKGQWRFIEVPLDYTEMERIVADCEAAVQAVRAIQSGGRGEEALPDYIEDTAVCRRCWAFGRLCTPPGLSVGEIPLLDDAELEAKLARRAELDEAAEEYETLDKEIKAAVRGRERLLIGDWLITGKESTVNYKAQPARTLTQWRTTIERLTARTP
jgi:hypothetical protein